MRPFGCSPRSRRIKSSEKPPMPRAGTNWHIAAGVTVGAADHAKKEALVAGIEDPPEHHREPAFHFPATALRHEPGQTLCGLCVELARVMERRRVTVLRYAVVGLAQALHVVPGQRETPARPRRPRRRCRCRACPTLGTPAASPPPAHCRHDPAAAVGEPAKGCPDLFALGAWARWDRGTRGRSLRIWRRPRGCRGGRTIACRSGG